MHRNLVHNDNQEDERIGHDVRVDQTSKTRKQAAHTFFSNNGSILRFGRLLLPCPIRWWIHVHVGQKKVPENKALGDILQRRRKGGKNQPGNWAESGSTTRPSSDYRISTLSCCSECHSIYGSHVSLTYKEASDVDIKVCGLTS